MATYKLLIEYDGTNLHGWQIQNGQPSVQGLIESALEVLFKGQTAVTGSGRTDAGVHARGQVAHFSIDAPIDPWKTKASLNGLLPREVRILDLEQAPAGFHARYDALARTYHYYVSTEPRALDAGWRWLLLPAPDFEIMNLATPGLIGERDFGAFCRTKSDTSNRVCRIDFAEWVPETRSGDWYFKITANRFLHGMVRAIVGTLVEVGRGKRSPEDLVRILESHDRRQAGQAAPARGLVLEHVRYESNE